MVKVLLTKETFSELSAKCSPEELEVMSILQPRADGFIEVDFSLDTVDRLNKLQLSGETHSDTILRILNKARGKLQ